MHNARLIPSCIIGKNVTIGNCTIGSNVTIGAADELFSKEMIRGIRCRFAIVPSISWCLPSRILRIR
ncbi:hypothetical protein IKQ19_09940 [Candidatus Saccharibacteria bacterium]|nr:hypothetical protein [Candidatus Saccharibacteria bacterium]